VAETSVRTGGEGELWSASENLKKAIEIHEKRREPFLNCRMHSNMAIVYEQLFLLTGSHERLKQCEETARTALSILDDQLPGDVSYMVRMQRANVEGTLAHCAFHLGRFPEAARLFETAQRKDKEAEGGFFIEDMAMWGAALFHAWAAKSPPTGEVNQNKLLHEALFKLDEAARLVALHGDFNEALQVFAQRGDAYWGQGNYRAAIRDYETVIALLEARKYALDRSFERMALLRKYRVLYGRVTEGYLRIAQEPTGPQTNALERGFQHSERSKARGLAEGMSLSKLMRRDLPEDLKDRLEKAYAGLKVSLWLRNKVVADGAPATAEQSQRLYQTRHAAAQDLDEVMKTIYAGDPRYAELVAPRIPSLTEVRSHLPEDGNTAILEFSVGEKALGVFLILRNVPVTETCFLIDGLGSPALEREFIHEGWLGVYDKHVVARANLRSCDLHRLRILDDMTKAGISANERQRLDEKAASLQQESRKLGIKVASTKLRWIEGLPQMLERIQHLIFEARGSNGQSIRGLLERHTVTRLVIVPDGLLHRLPLHAAMDRLESVTLAPSSAVLLDAVSRLERRPAKALVVAPLAQHPLVPDDEERRTFLQEADFIQSSLVSADVEVVRLNEEEATADAIMRQLPECACFHFCGHAESDFRTPVDSHLKLAAGTSSESHEQRNGQILTAGTLLAKGVMKQGAWVVLHACESGITPPEPNGECLGLPAGFLLAGAGLVTSTLWEVPLEAPGSIMAGFYDGALRHDLPPAVALQRGIVALRKTGTEAGVSGSHSLNVWPEPSHPFHWAGFVIWGGAWLKDETPPNALQLGTHEEPLPAPPIGAGSGVPPQLQKVLHDTRPQLEQKRFAEASGILEQALAEFGACTVISERLGGCYADMGDFDRALPHWQKLVESDPNSFYHHYNLGCIYRDFARTAEARECFKKALSLNPVYAKVLFNLAGLTNDPEHALDYLRRAQAITPEDPDLPGAFRMWEELRAHPQAKVEQHRMFWAEQALQNGDLAHAHFQLVMARDGNLTDKETAMVCRAESDILRKEEKLAESVRKLEEAIQFDPSVPAYWNTLGARRLLLAEDSTDLTQAEVECRRAIDLKDYAKPHQNLASIYLRLGQGDQARQEVAKAAALAADQLRAGAFGKLVCIGCPTEGKQRAECDLCMQKATALKRDVDLLAGEYRIDCAE
jgi:tetratricopeptide (TPR) repeat protein